MAEPKYHRLALAQLSFNPAYLDASGVSYLHEPIFLAEGDPGLYMLAGLLEIDALRARIATSLIDHMSHKIKAIIDFSARQGVELLVLPEYSVPLELLEECKNLSVKSGMVIVAGSHIANKPALSEYARLKMTRPGEEIKLGSAACPVFLPTGECQLFQKLHRAKWESTLVPGIPTAPLSLPLRKEKVNLEVLICIDAVHEPTPQKSKRARVTTSLTAMPSLTPSPKLFYSKAELLLAAGKVTLFANIAEFGGSRLFARTERAKGWLVGSDGTEPIPQYSEALIIADADLSGQFDVRKSTQEHFPVSAVSIVPLLYPRHSEACGEFMDLVAAVQEPSRADPELLENAKRFAAMDYKLFPRMMQEKVHYFLANVVASGLADREAWLKWLAPVPIETTASTDTLRWDLCGKAIDIVNELNLSDKYPEKTDVLTSTYKYLMSKRKELRGRLNPPSPRTVAPPVVLSEEPISLPANLGSFEPPFFDRNPLLSSLQKFIGSSEKSCFVLAGMRGIGKTSIIREAFKKVIAPTWKRVLIPLTEGASYPRLLAEFAHQSGLRLPG